MAAPSLTYTLTNGQTADASQVMQNFSDLLNGITDGTKDLSISALTCAGITTLNGNVIIGNASSDDLTVTGSLASSIPIKTTRTYDIGSADLGLRTLYLGGNSTHTVALSAPSSGYSGDVTFALPTSNGTAGYFLSTDGSGNTSWATPGKVNSVSSAGYTVTTSDGYGTIALSTGSSDRTVALPAAASSSGRVLRIIKTDTGAGGVVADGDSGETVGGAATQTIYGQYGSMILVCDGSAWYNLTDPISYYTDTVIFSFNGSGGGNSSSITFTITKKGKMVTFQTNSSISATTGTTSTFLSATTVPSWARPSVEYDAPVGVFNNSTNLTTMGRINISTGGVVTFYRDYLSTAFTNSVACGVVGSISATYRQT